MKLRLDGTRKHQNVISAIFDDHIVVRDESCRSSIILTADNMSAWNPTSVTALAAAHMTELLEFSPEIVLIGTGTRLEFPAMECLRPLIDTGTGYEIMNNAAACRTFNVLVSEDRRVVLGIILPAIRD
ncbi:MAG: MTH938/NDUFAF3 family protein [Gammaproteobacteria bacterium]|nr:MTH938/NDUFAF3 family protein [Gammaproteobacteria bacterium]